MKNGKGKQRKKAREKELKQLERQQKKTAVKKKTPVFQKTFITRSKARNEADAQSDGGTADECSV